MKHRSSPLRSPLSIARRTLILQLTMATVWVLVAMLGCTPAAPATVTPAPAASKTHVTCAGSTSVQPLMTALAEEYMAEYDDVWLDIAGGGSLVGIQSIHDGTVDIGMASRRLSDSESAGIELHQVAVDVIAVIVHPDNQVDSLTLEAIAAVYGGQVLNWQELGGADLAIVPVGREQSSGTRGSFDSIVLGGEDPSHPELEELVTAGDVQALVADEQGAIGYVGFGNVDDEVRVLAVGGVSPSPETVRAGNYELVRPLYLLTGGLSQPEARAFIGYATGPEGQAIVSAEGWLAIR